MDYVVQINLKKNEKRIFLIVEKFVVQCAFHHDTNYFVSVIVSQLLLLLYLNIIRTRKFY